MAFLATERRVFAHKREPRRLVPLDHIRNFPGLYGMTSRAVGAEFRLVDVRVARRAAFARSAELEIPMTIDARHGLVLSCEEESGLSVIEARIRTHRPGIGGVARLAGNRQIAVG